MGISFHLLDTVKIKRYEGISYRHIHRRYFFDFAIFVSMLWKFCDLVFP